MRGEHDISFEAMGSHVRLLIGEPGPGLEPAPVAAEGARRLVHEFDAALSRFKPGSELCALNADPDEIFPASPLLRRAVRAGIEAATRTYGLVDPTLVAEIEGAGYVESRVGVAAASLPQALAEAPPRRPARPSPERRWAQLEVDDEAGVIRRPPGLRFDTGGTGKGLAADLVAESLRGYERFVVDCGGDIRIGGAGALVDPYDVHVEHPLSGGGTFVLRLGGGGVATSGLNVRIWRGRDGRFFHHLIDPASGEPAWTGLIGATALGDTALEAETLSKAALLSGPEGAREVLGGLGGLIVHESGRVETVGPLSVRPRIRWPEPTEAARAAA